ncbi:MAG: hypothetical protein USCAAHI_00932 [Beijerinckiaceae bacterium]|nr:MAG: hypothetical protein USCAAHI_00932 [Beijerinckiaceae bacterium]
MERGLPVSPILAALSSSTNACSRDEVMETMGMAVYIGAGPSVMYAAQAVEAHDQFEVPAS